MFRINLKDNETYKTKLICGEYKYPVEITKKNTRLWLSYSFNRNLNEQFKADCEGIKYHGFDDNPIKQWSISDTSANWFRIAVMEGKNPFKWWERPLIDYTPSRQVYAHQVDMIRQGITYRYTILAAEMGTGKTLSAIEIIEALKFHKVMWVAPRSALWSVKLEFEKWNAKIIPGFYTYEGMKKFVLNELNAHTCPQIVIFDESSRMKNYTSQRTQAGYILAEKIREIYGWDGAVIEMSGSPAPKDPGDWYSQCRIAMPGFLKETDYNKFKNRLAIIGKGESEIGGIFPRLIAWRDDEKKCNICGLAAEDPSHDIINMVDDSFHTFTPSVNEVQKLYRRMKGLVLVKLKKDCLDLPDKQYKLIKCKPNHEILNAAKLIAAKGGTAVKVMTLLRELSDGFQYDQEDVGTETCPVCKGKRTRLDWIYTGPDEEFEKSAQNPGPPNWVQQEMACSYCDGVGEVTTYKRAAIQVPCPKEDVLKDLIDQHDDVGRLVTYAGFTGSIDRCCQIFKKMNWDFIRVDGRGWTSTLEGLTPKDLLKKFQSKEDIRFAFIGQPGAAGMGLNLTASPSIIYYSNDFNAESRIQSEDRIHRLGMDVNRGATIYDIIHLPTDQAVLDNLKKKRKLQSMTMGEIASIMESSIVNQIV